MTSLWAWAVTQAKRYSPNSPDSGQEVNLSHPSERPKRPHLDTALTALKPRALPETHPIRVDSSLSLFFPLSGIGSSLPAPPTQLWRRPQTLRERTWALFTSMTGNQVKQSPGKAKWPFSQTFPKHVRQTPSCWKIGLLSFHIPTAIEVHFLIIYCKLQAEKVGHVRLQPINSWSSFASSEGPFSTVA